MAKFPTWQPVLLITCAALVCAGCNTPQGQVNPTSTAAFVESKSYVDVVRKLKVTIETLDGLVTAQRSNDAKFETMKLVELASSLRNFDPKDEPMTPSEDEEYNGQVKDLVYASNVVWSFANDHQFGSASDAMSSVIQRFNRLVDRFGPGQAAKASRGGAVVANR